MAEPGSVLRSTASKKRHQKNFVFHGACYCKTARSGSAAPPTNVLASTRDTSPRGSAFWNIFEFGHKAAACRSTSYRSAKILESQWQAGAQDKCDGRDHDGLGFEDRRKRIGREFGSALAEGCLSAKLQMRRHCFKRFRPSYSDPNGEKRLWTEGRPHTAATQRQY